MPPTWSLQAAVVWVLVVAGAPVLVAAPAEAKAARCTIVGTAGEDILRGTPGDDVICGLGGDDKIVGRGGDDVLRGGGGSDVVRGGPGDDRVSGGRGADRVFGQGGDDIVRGDSGDDEVVGGRGNDRLGGFRGADQLSSDGDAGRFVDDVRCGPGPDTVSADPVDVVRRDCETVAQNDPPTDISLVPAAISENEPIGTDIGGLTVVDPDPGDSHTFSLVPGAGSADNALVRIDGDSLESSVGYDFEADSSFSVRVRATDEAGQFTEKAFTVTVTDANDAPVAVDDDATTDEDTTLTAPVSGPSSYAANDTDQDGDPLTVTAVSNASGGTASVTSGLVDFAPSANLCGNNAGQFDYTVSDGNGGTDTGTVTVDITCVDDNPDAVNDAETVDEDSGATTFTVLDNDTDPESDAIAVTGVTQPTNGTVTFTADDVDYTPDSDYCNAPGAAPDDTFTYTITGGDSATVSVTVTCVNDAPIAVDDDRTTDEDTPLSDPVTGAGSPAANDDDVDGDALTVTAVTNPTGGTVAIAAGQITFTPTANLCGTNAGSYDYTVSDGNGGTDTGSVTIDITCVNDAPVANDDSRTVDEDSEPTTFGTLLDNDTDVESDPITITGASDPANGTTTFTAGDVTYTPDADFCGADSFTYTVNGGDTATVTVTVTCVDDAPVANDDDRTVTEDAAATAFTVLGNDVDVEGDAITIASASDPANGTVVLTGGSPGAHTGLTYEPDGDYCNDPGAPGDDQFTYTVNGGASATVSVVVTCVDDDPTANDDTATVTLDDPATAVDVLGNDDNDDGGPIAIASASDPANGTVVLTGGSPGAHTGLTYEPDGGYCNTDNTDPDDTFTYALTPGGDTATVSVEVTCDVPPVGVDDGATVTEDDPATAVDVLANDSDGGDGGVKAIASATQPDNGTVVLTGGTPGAHTGLTYEPDPDYCNDPGAAPEDTFSYTLTPGSDTAQVSVTVTCVDDDPTANDDSATVAEDSGATPISVLANDDNGDGGPLDVTGASDPANGSTTFTASSVSYTPDLDYCGADSFTYTVTGGDTATVSVTVTCVPDAPTLDNSAGTTTYTEDTLPVAIDSAVAISNPDGLDITAGSVTLTADLPGDGLDWTDNNAGDAITEGSSSALQVALTGTGTAAQWEAALEAVTFATSSQDPSGADRTATFSITTSAGSPTDTKLVDAVNVDDLPVAVDDAATVLEDAAAAAVTVLTNDTDVDSGPMTITAVSDPANGSALITGGGTGLTYAPDPNYCNDPGAAPEDTFTYSLNGSGAPAQTATVSMTVTCVNDAPVADDENFSGANGAIGNTSLVVDDPSDGPPSVVGPRRSVAGDILAGDTDIDGPGPLTVTAGTFTTNDGGSVTVEADGDFTYLPDDDVGCGDGSDFFDYTLNDSGSPNLTDTGQVTISITDCVWYVQAAAAPGGTGSSSAPFDTLTPLNGAGGAGDVDDASDFLFVYGGGTFTTGIILENNQRLYGQPGGLTVDGTALVAAGGTNPNIRNTTVGGNGVTLANGADVQAVNVGVTGAASSFGIRGIAVTTATVGSGVLVQGNGIGVGLQSAAAGNITVAATVNGSTGAAVSVQNRSSGTVTFSGDITSTQNNGTVEFVNNAGATLVVSGKLDISGSSTTSLDVRGGGTFSATNAANTITGITGPLAVGVNLDGVTVASAGVVLNTLSTIAGGGGNGLVVNGVTGTGPVTVNGGTLTTSTRGVDVNGGSGNVTVGATLEPTGGRSVEVTGHTGGTIDLNGLVNEDQTGVNLTGNTGATVRFDGGLVASTGANTAFNATGGGTVVVTDPNAVGTAPDNTLATVLGRALNVVSTNIGTDGLTFRSISSNGAPNGIVLNNTGGSAGLEVTGDGGGSSNGSGGVIASSTGIGVSLTSTTDVDLGYLNVTGSADAGIKGIGVTGFRLNRSNVNNNGNSTADEGIQFGEFSGSTVGVTGAVSILNSSVSGNAHNNVHVRNTSGTISSFTVTGSNFNNLNDVTGANAFLFEASGTSVTTTATISGSTFQNNSPQRALEVQVHDTGTIGSGANAFTVSGNTFIDNGIHASFTQDTAGNLQFKFQNNGTAGAPMTGSILQAVNVFSSSQSTGGTLVGTISGNFIGNAAVANSGSTQGGAISAVIQGQTDATLLIDNNTTRQTSGDSRAISAAFRGPANPLAGTLGPNTVVSDLTITNNNVVPGAAPSGFPLAAIVIEADNQTGADNKSPTVRADVRGNSVPSSSVFDFIDAQLIYYEYTGGGSHGIGQLVDSAPASANATAQLQSTNTGTAAAGAGSADVALIPGPIITPP